MKTMRAFFKRSTADVMLMKNACTVLLLCLASCSGPGRAFPETEILNSVISESERQAIMRKLESWDITTGIGEIERLSVDTFSVNVRGSPHHVSLQEDGIHTEGELTPSDMDSIKEKANRHRSLSQFDISSIKQTSSNTVEVMTGDFGTATGEVILLQRTGTVWQVKSVGRWVE